MSRYYFSKKEEAGGLQQISVSFLKRYHYFDNGWHSGNITFSRQGIKTGSIGIRSYISDYEQYVELIYTQTDRFTEAKTDFDYKISLTTTDCNLGGKRYWFICSCTSNGVYCGRRVGVLYISDKYFACRHCYNLTYSSRNLGGLFKAVGQVISQPYLEELRQQVKREHYAGKITKKYRRYLNKERKSELQLMKVAYGLKATDPYKGVL